MKFFLISREGVLIFFSRLIKIFLEQKAVKDVCRFKGSVIFLPGGGPLEIF